MPITGIKFIDISKGWACTGTFNVLDTGFIMNTTNGGTNWNIQLSYPAMKFTDIEFINQNTGFISGNQNDSARTKLFTTTNGGLNWSYISMVTNMYIDDMQYLNKDSAWECGSSAGPDVRTTTDGGNTWVVRTNGILSATQKIFFLNYNTGFCGASNRIYKTTDAGLNWSLIGQFVQSITSLYFENDNKGWLGFTGYHLRFTSNNGLNWVDQTLPFIAGTPIYDICFLNSNTGYAGYGFDKILKTTNGGNDWGYQVDTGGSLHLSFIDVLNGWTANFIGITHTINGGGQITYTGLQNINNEIPNSFKLYQNYPNPFNPITNVKYQITQSTFVNITVYDILGRNIETLVNENQKAGTYLVDWNAQKYTSGIYFYKLITKDYSETRKMTLIK